MKKQIEKMQQSSKRSGFTLVETAIALGMVAVMISSFVVVFGPAMKGINKSLSSKDADRLTNALELELGVLRNGETYATTFDKSFLWIQQSTQTSQNPVLVYQYRGNPDSVRTDGTLNPYPYNATNPGIPGKDYVIQTSVRRLKDAFHTSKIQAELAPGVLEGKVYYVKMTQLIYNASGEMVLGTPGTIKDLQPPNTVRASSAAYTDAVLPFRAEFYEVKPPLWSFVNSSWTVPAASEIPVLIKNMAVMR